MNAYSFTVQDVSALSKELEACRASFEPKLGIIFASTGVDLDVLQSFFSENDVPLFGCTSAGGIHNNTMVLGQIVGQFLDIDPAHFSMHFTTQEDGDIFEQARAVARAANDLYDKPALIVVSGGFGVNADEIIGGLKEDLTSFDIPIFGGLAGDDINLYETFIFSDKKISNNGILTLVLDNEFIEVNGLAICGWETIGAEHTITKCEGSTVYSIDDEPALDFFIKHFGAFHDITIEASRFEDMSAQYPLQFIRKNGVRVLRSPIKANEEEGAFLLAGGVHEGDRFKFSMSPGFSVVEQTVCEFENLGKSHPYAESLILFSCAGRYAALGPMIEDEIRGISKQWNAPLTGLFSFGEIGNSLDGECDFHNETCCLVMLSTR